MGNKAIKLELSSSEALVLFEFLSRFTTNDKLEIADQAEQRVLWDLCSLLESQLTAPLESNYNVQLSDARSKVRDRDV